MRLIGIIRVEVGEEVDDFLEIFFNDSTTRN
jgi:hypothetical protein